MSKTRKARMMEGLCIAVTFVALLVMLGGAWSWPPQPNRSLHQAIGAALARQALALLGPGGQIVVITRDTGAFRQPASDLLLDSFEKEVRRASVKIAAIQRIQLDPLRPVEAPSGDFYEWLRRAPAGQVIVSLLGPPLLSEEQWRRLRPIKARIVAFCPGNTARNIDLGRLFDAGFLHAAVVSRPPSRISVKKQSDAETFDDLYVQVTAADRSQLSAVSGSSP
jgi:hypothetical protein